MVRGQLALAQPAQRESQAEPLLLFFLVFFFCVASSSDVFLEKPSMLGSLGF